MDSTQLSRFKKQVKELSQLRGQGTELVSLYIPPKYPVNEITSQLSSEASQAANIKSKQTRTNVQGALQRIIQYLKAINYKLPENGLAVFSGNLSRDAGSDKIQLFSIEPPKALRSRIYQCDSRFFLEPLQEQLATDEIYGLIVVDKREATVAVLKGKSYEIAFHANSWVPGKARAGGQSALRYERIRDIATHEFFVKTAEAANAALVPIHDKVKGIIVGGPGSTKDDFLKEDLLNHLIKNKVLGTLNTGYTDEYGIKELIDNSDQLLRETTLMQEKKLLSRFLKEVVTNGLATYGPKETLEAVERGQSESVLLSEDCPWVKASFQCSKCGEKQELLLQKSPSYSKACKSCQGPLSLLEEKPFEEHFEEVTDKTGLRVEVISAESPEGKQFLDAFGGVGCFLRYKL